MRIPRPLKDQYAVTVAIAILAIAPYIFVTTGYALFGKELDQAIGVSKTALSLIDGLSIAGYAFGALLGGDLIQRFPQRALFFACESIIVAGCLVAATAGGTVQFGAGNVLFGLGTGLMLVVALPPVVQRFPAKRMTTTTAWINIGFFGAVAAGPLLGGAVAYGHAWQWFYGGFAALGAITFVLALLTLPDKEAMNPDQPFDWHAAVLAFLGTVLPFWGTAELTGHPFHSYLFMVPLAVGLAAFVALILSQYHKEQPMAPVKPMWHTAPISGVLVAMFGGAVLVTLMELLERFELQVVHATPLATGLYFWPAALGAVLSAIALGAVIRTRLLVLLPLAGMVLLVGAAALMLFLRPQSPPSFVLALTGLIGLGAGATVGPGLWVAGLALPSKMVGKTFSLVELVRSEADFIIAPILLGVAVLASGGTTLKAGGVHDAVGLTLLVAIVSTVAVAAIFISGGVGLVKPDLEQWLERADEKEPAFESPEVGAVLTGKRAITGETR